MSDLAENRHQINLWDIDVDGNWYVKSSQNLINKELTHTASFHTHQDNGILEPENLTNKAFIQEKIEKLSTGLTVDGQEIENNKRTNSFFTKPTLKLPAKHRWKFLSANLRKNATNTISFVENLIKQVEEELVNATELDKVLTKIIVRSIDKKVFKPFVSEIYRNLFKAIQNGEGYFSPSLNPNYPHALKPALVS